MKLPDTLKPFTAHGVVIKGHSGDNYFGDCPFTGSEDKFYVNAKNQLWDIKHLGMSGNINQWLETVASENSGKVPLKAKLRLSRDRGGFPWDAFKPWGIGFNGLFYTLPVRNGGGRVVDVRRYKPGDRIKTTPGCKPGLLGCEHVDNHQGEPIYVCEGEWDTMALRWLLNQVNERGDRKSVV